MALTNIEITLAIAVKAMYARLLTENEGKFIRSIQDYDKKQLNNLTEKQYKWLHAIYTKYRNRTI